MARVQSARRDRSHLAHERLRLMADVDSLDWPAESCGVRSRAAQSMLATSASPFTLLIWIAKADQRFAGHAAVTTCPRAIARRLRDAAPPGAVVVARMRAMNLPYWNVTAVLNEAGIERRPANRAGSGRVD